LGEASILSQGKFKEKADSYRWGSEGFRLQNAFSMLRRRKSAESIRGRRSPAFCSEDFITIGLRGNNRFFFSLGGGLE